MHHLIYSEKDTYITSRTNLDGKNFGIDEILQIGTTNTPQRILSPTKDYVYDTTIFNHQPVTYFTGIFTGSFGGTVAYLNGTISGSDLVFSTTYFNGIVDNVVVEGSGSISGSLVDGYITGSIITSGSIGLFIGEISGANACLYGTASGIDSKNEPYWTTTDVQFIDRTLFKFDLTAISNSIVNGEIVNPEFHLKVKVCNEYDLPITYNIYALPISQSWEMGDGYFSDGGSDTGVSWLYKDNNDGTPWYTPYVTGHRYPIDYISDPSLATSSFGYGGGTWYTGSVCSQKFQYESADIDMDITDIVFGWLHNDYPNEGLMLVSSDELQATGSGFILKYFSRDTNTVYSPCLDVMWDDVAMVGYTTGSQYTSSIIVTTVNTGISASIQSGSYYVSALGISGSFSASTYLRIDTIGTTLWSTLFHLWSLIPWTWGAGPNTDYWGTTGFVNGWGYSGTVNGVPIYGQVSASITSHTSIVTGSCGQTYEYRLASGWFIDGPFSGSDFIAYYNDFEFINGIITGSRNEQIILSSPVTIPIPSGIDPYAYAYINGTYLKGTALGRYTVYDSASAKFDGQFTEGILKGSNIYLNLSGSVVTSSYSYTSSINITSSILTEMDIDRPFTVTLQNMNPIYKAGDIVKIGVFSRKRFPLKTFGKVTQQEQYLIPEYLPSSSYYAIVDNQTDEILINFDSYTRLGCEYPYGNYFTVDTTSLPQDRYYKILVRVEDGSSIYTIDCGKTFKIIR